MKGFFIKLKEWFIAHAPSKRRIMQLYAALLYNANIKGFITGKISTAPTKNMCVPGFNCYSCPGAVGSCPLGSLQNALGSGKTSTIAYVFGILMLFGLILGRTICGFLCPMGLLQDLLYKIKSPKVKKSKITRVLSYFKYVLLLVFVVIMPLIYSKVIVLPAFCQFICPVGLISGFTLLANPTNVGELVSLGVLFTWKFCVATVILIGAIFTFRPFCRFFCPLGAIYGFFSKFALLGITLDKKSCIDCGLCLKTCKVDIHHVGDHECIQCGECVAVCPTKAISWKGGKLFVLPNQTESSVTENVDLHQLVNKTEESDNAQIAVENESVKNSVQVDAKSVKEKKEPLYALRKNNGKGFKIIACVLLAVILVSALVYFNFFAKEVVSKTTYSVGDTIENFEAREFFSTDGTYKLEEDSGKIVVLNFWYIGCGGCETEMPHFGALANDEKYKDKVSVVVVHSNDDIFGAEEMITDGGKEMPAIEWYITSEEAKNWGSFAGNIKWIMDLDGEDSLYLSLGGTGAWPMTAIVDENGVIKFITASSVTEEILYEEIDKIIAE